MKEVRKGPEHLYDKVTDLLKKAQGHVVQTVNRTMVSTYFEIGKTVVDEEQNGAERAEYGKQLISGLSKRLSKEFGKGFSPTNIKQMRSFHVSYPKGQTLSDKFSLSWSHYLRLMRMDDEHERRFYERADFCQQISNSAS